MTRSSHFAALVSLACCFGWPLVAAAQRPGQIEIWSRAPGQYAATPAPARVRVVTIDLDSAGLRPSARADVQYEGASQSYRLVTIEELLRKYGPPPETDVALLHFDNGMAIPLPFRDRAAMERLRPAVARAIWIDGKWSNRFPIIMKKDVAVDARPIEFDGNKLVVADRWHPDVSDNAQASFSPWLYADSLAGIELVRGAAYLAQFDVDPKAEPGFSLYAQSCRFCHGARHVGAAFGWDFVEPLPISEYRKTSKNLYYHVHYRASNKGERGLMMPALSFLTEDDAGALLAWLRAVAARPLRAYSTDR